MNNGTLAAAALGLGPPVGTDDRKRETWTGAGTRSRNAAGVGPAHHPGARAAAAVDSCQPGRVAAGCVCFCFALLACLRGCGWLGSAARRGCCVHTTAPGGVGLPVARVPAGVVKDGFRSAPTNPSHLQEIVHVWGRSQDQISAACVHAIWLGCLVAKRRFPITLNLRYMHGILNVDKIKN